MCYGKRICAKLLRQSHSCPKCFIVSESGGTVFAYQIYCHVLQADGGTRTAAITGAYVALVIAMNKLMRDRKIATRPLKSSVAAVSVGIVGGEPMLDLNYAEDSRAEVDFNVVMNSRGEFVEVQGTGEGATFSRAQMDELLRLAKKGIDELLEIQRQTLKDVLK